VSNIQQRVVAALEKAAYEWQFDEDEDKLFYPTLADAVMSELGLTELSDRLIKFGAIGTLTGDLSLKANELLSEILKKCPWVPHE
jgi:hypothetical protein